MNADGPRAIEKSSFVFNRNSINAFLFTAAGIAQSSQFFLNNMLIAAGTETLFELSQLRGIISHIVIYQFVTIKATSKRMRERMRAPISLEWGDIVPKFIFSLLVGTVYWYVSNNPDND